MSLIISHISSSQHPIPLERITQDTHAYLFDNDKISFLESRKVKNFDKNAISIYDFIDKIMPAIEEKGFDVVAARFKKNMSIASIVANNQPIPMTGTGSLEEAISNLFKIAIGHSFNEDDRIKFAQMRQAGRIPPSIVEGLFKNVDDLQPKVMRTAIYLTFQLLRTGAVSFQDPRTGLNARMDYNFMPSLFPPPLTGAAAWNNPTTANALEDLEEHLEIYREINGYDPDFIGMRRTNWRNVRRQETTRAALVAENLANTSTQGDSAVSMAQLKKLFEQRELPQPVILDGRVQIEPQPGRFINVNLMNDNEYFFANRGMGNRVFGNTIESDKKGTNYKSGIFLDLDPHKSTDTEEKVVAIGRFVPVVDDPKTLGARTTHQLN